MLSRYCYCTHFTTNTVTLMMTGAPVESLDILMKTCSQWLSFKILRHQDQLQNAQFRILERILEKNN